jgi:glycosyltransferase involved in cell wall biosynthesis
MWTGAGVLLRLAALASLRRWPVAWSAVSLAAAEALRRSIRNVDVAVLPNAVDVGDWTLGPNPSPASPVPTTDRRPVTVVSVMRLMPRKRPLALLQMFVQLRQLVPHQELRLVIVGDGPLRPKVERYVSRHGLSDAVRVTGRIPRAQVIGELRSADVYVAPAPKESFGIAALEARCTGLPVVAHRSSGVTEFIGDRVDGLLVGDDTEMVVALAELASSPDLLARIAAHNSRVRPSHDWSEALEQTDVLYRRAAERTGRTAPRALPVAEPAVAGA